MSNKKKKKRKSTSHGVSSSESKHSRSNSESNHSKLNSSNSIENRKDEKNIEGFQTPKNYSSRTKSFEGKSSDEKERSSFLNLKFLSPRSYESPSSKQIKRPEPSPLQNQSKEKRTQYTNSAPATVRFSDSNEQRFIDEDREFWKTPTTKSREHSRLEPSKERVSEPKKSAIKKQQTQEKYNNINRFSFFSVKLVVILLTFSIFIAYLFSFLKKNRNNKSDSSIKKNKVF